jgi:hypothetical protein
MKNTAGFFLILLKRYKMKFFWLLIFIFGITACRKDLTGTDYDELIGKYKLVYILKLSSSSYEKIIPSDNYEIEFNRNGKVYKYKNGHCESKEKVEDCDVLPNSPPSQYAGIFLDLKNRSNTVQMAFPYYGVGYDTLTVSGYYPYEDDPNQSPYRYGHYYVKE